MLKINNKGFSLIELMVVVAIIAILASFAIPQYQNFQAKARQKEGLTLLGNYYTAAVATQVESGAYNGNFEAIGFQPQGQVHFRILALDGPNPPTGPNNDTCVNTSAPAGCTAAFSALWTQINGGTFGAATPVGCVPANGGAGTTFTTCASAIIRPAGDADTWSMNQLKAMVNTNSGVN